MGIKLRFLIIKMLFFNPSKKIFIYLVRMVEPYEFQDDYIGTWKLEVLYIDNYLVHELRLRMLGIFKWVRYSGPYQHPH